jgi:hypothetical protein
LIAPIALKVIGVFVCKCGALDDGILIAGIAALSVTFFLAVKKKVTKEKLPAAPASMMFSAITSGVVAESDDAGVCR